MKGVAQTTNNTTSVKIHWLEENKQKLYSLNTPVRYEELIAKCREYYEGHCEILLRFEISNEVITSPKQFQKFITGHMKAEQGNNNLRFKASVVGGARKIEQISSLLKRAVKIKVQSEQKSDKNEEETDNRNIQQVQMLIQNYISDELKKNPKKGESKEEHLSKILKKLEQYLSTIISSVTQKVSQAYYANLMKQSQINFNMGQQCVQCKYTNFKGPVYRCLLCPQPCYLCSRCEMKAECKNHRIKAHPFAKLKYSSQWIHSIKEVKLVSMSDIIPPGFEEEKIDKQKKKLQQIKREQNLFSQKGPEIPSNNSNKKSTQQNSKISEIVNVNLIKNGSEQNYKKQEKVTNSNKKINVNQGKKLLPSEEQPIKVYNGKQLSQLDWRAKQKKRNKLKGVFKKTDEQVDIFMKGKFQYMDYLAVINYLQQPKKQPQT